MVGVSVNCILFGEVVRTGGWLWSHLDPSKNTGAWAYPGTDTCSIWGGA